MQNNHASRIRRSGGLAEKADAALLATPHNPQLRIYAQSARRENQRRKKSIKNGLCGYETEWENSAKIERGNAFIVCFYKPFIFEVRFNNENTKPKCKNSRKNER